MWPDIAGVPWEAGSYEEFGVLDDKANPDKGIFSFGPPSPLSQVLEMVLPLIKQGKLAYVEDVVEGIEAGPAALVGLFSGRNVGKQLVAIASQ